MLVLCVGRLSHHAKAHPFPAFHAADQAARRTGKKVLLVFAGWAAHPAIDRAYREGAAQFAPAAASAFVDGQDPAVRTGAWHAADVFLSLPDNIQETFGLVVVEGMASGLPVVGSDWDGYRDLIVDGETGYLSRPAWSAGRQRKRPRGCSLAKSPTTTFWPNAARRRSWTPTRPRMP